MPALRDLRLGVAVLSASAVGYTMVGYPLLMALRARTAPRPLPRTDHRPTITVLVPAHNEADVIARKLDSILALDYPREQLDVLVVDDGSTDGTGEIVRRYVDEHGVRCLPRTPRAGKMAAINAGMAEARGELVLLTDASATFPTASLLAAVAPFAADEVGVVSGQNLIRGGGGAVEQPAGLYWRYQERLRHWESLTGSTVGVTGNLFVFRRGDYRPLPDDTINDEFAIAMDVAGRGRRVLYEPEAVAYDEASASMDEEMARRTRINAGRYQSLARYCAAVAREPSLLFRLVSHKVLRVLTPLFLLALAVSSLRRVPADGAAPRRLLAGLHRYVLRPGQLALYGAAAAGRLLERAGRPLPKAVSVPYFFVASNTAAFGGLLRFLRGGQSVIWQKRSATTGTTDFEEAA